MYQDRAWKFLKYLSFAVMAVLTVVLFVQYVVLANLRSESENLSSDYSSMEIEYQQKSDLKNELEENYDKYVEDNAKENLDMKNSGEEVFSPQNN